jgi:hypothetical protein
VNFDFSGPPNFGVGTTEFAASSGSGDLLGLDFDIKGVGVPENYISGSTLNSTSTFAGQSFASLGVSPGTYTWTWNNNGNQDSFTLTIVPEPSMAGLLGIFGLQFFTVRRRRTD